MKKPNAQTKLNQKKKLKSLSYINNREVHAKILFIKTWKNSKPASFTTNFPTVIDVELERCILREHKFISIVEYTCPNAAFFIFSFDVVERSPVN